MSGNELELETLNQSEKNRKGKLKFIICGLLIVIAIGIGLYVGYKKLNNDPISVYKTAINYSYKKLNNLLNESKENRMDLDLNNEPIKFELNAKLDSNMKELANFTGLNYYLGVGMDYHQELMNFELGIKNKNETIISAILSAFEKNLYFKSSEIFSKVLNLGENDVFESMSDQLQTNNVNYENYELILKEIKTILIDSLRKEQFKTADAKININDKEYKVQKVSYFIDEKTIDFIREAILKNDDLKEAIATTLGITLTTLEDSLKKDADYHDFKEIELVLYTNGLNNIIGGEIVEEDNTFVSFTCHNSEINIEITNETEKITINKDKNNLVSIKFNDGTTDLIDLLIEMQKNKDTKIDYRLNFEGVSVNGTMEETNIKRTKDKISGDISLTVNTSVLGTPINIGITGNYVVNKEALTKLDTASSIKATEMTEAEAAELLENFSKVLEKLGLKDIVEDLL